jgi:hypothetical protein
MARKPKTPVADATAAAPVVVPDAAPGPGGLSTTITIRPAPYVSESTEIIYANYAEVVSSAYEFGIILTRLPTKPTREMIETATAGAMFEVEATSQLIVPVALVPGLIRALTVQKGIYESQYGPIHDPGLSDDQAQ